MTSTVKYLTSQQDLVHERKVTGKNQPSSIHPGDAVNKSDAELVLCARKGDREAYGILVERYAALIYRLAVLETRDPDAAEDITQTAFMKGFEHLARLRRPEVFSAWIVGIVRNDCSSYRRQIRRRPLSLEALMESGQEPSVPSSTPRLIEEEHQRALSKAITVLPRKYREILALRYTKGTSYQQLSEVFGLSMSAVKNRLLRAKKLVIKHLQREGYL